jgi:hypothetical protein
MFNITACRYGTVEVRTSNKFNLVDYRPIDLVFIDQQNVGKKSVRQIDTVNAKKRWKTISWRVNKFLKENHIETRNAKERA